MALVVDTGVLYSALNRTEPEHFVCRRLLETSGEDILIPSPVLPEVAYFIGEKLHQGILIGLLRDIQIGNLRVVDLISEDYFRVEEVVAQYADANIGFVDASVLAIVERLNETKLATLDHRHFGMMRPRHVEALTLLPA